MIEGKKLPKIGKIKVVTALLAAVLTVGVLSYLYLTYFKNDLVSSEGYYAVFLDNNQVYFGNMVSKSKEELILTNVYYLQVSAGASEAVPQLSDPRFTLIKLGQELHGPTDELMINREHVVFYEKLREDSKVVESIKNQQ